MHLLRSSHWRHELAHVARFFCVALGACLVDAGVGLTLVNGMGLRLHVGVVAGFMAGLVCAYVLHRLWTFRAQVQAGGVRGVVDQTSAVRFLCSNAVLLALRLGIVQILGWACVLMGIALSPLTNTAIYVIMLGMSFCINYVFCRLWVFRAH